MIKMGDASLLRGRVRVIRVGRERMGYFLRFIWGIRDFVFIFYVGIGLLEYKLFFSERIRRFFCI